MGSIPASRAKINNSMQMLIDWHQFQYHASVPWPQLQQSQVDWEQGIRQVEGWLNNNIGHRLSYWAWHDSQAAYNIGVSFRWDQDRVLFILAWA